MGLGCDAATAPSRLPARDGPAQWPRAHAHRTG